MLPKRLFYKFNQMSRISQKDDWQLIPPCSFSCQKRGGERRKREDEKKIILFPHLFLREGLGGEFSNLSRQDLFFNWLLNIF